MVRMLSVLLPEGAPHPALRATLSPLRGARDLTNHRSSMRNAAPCQYFLYRAAAVSDGLFSRLCASASPKSERGLFGLRFKPSLNTYSASPNWPARIKAAPSVSRAG